MIFTDYNQAIPKKNHSLKVIPSAYNCHIQCSRSRSQTRPADQRRTTLRWGPFWESLRIMHAKLLACVERENDPLPIRTVLPIFRSNFPPTGGGWKTWPPPARHGHCVVGLRSLYLRVIICGSVWKCRPLRGGVVLCSGRLCKVGRFGCEKMTDITPRLRPISDGENNDDDTPTRQGFGHWEKD